MNTFAMALLCGALVYAPSFEGVALYRAEVHASDKIKLWGMTNEALVDDLKKDGVWADTVVFMYKHGNYVVERASELPQRTIYRADSNKVYVFDAGADVCTATDAAEVSDFAAPREQTTVLYDSASGTVLFQWDAGSYMYCFTQNDSLYIAPELFAAHQYNGWNQYLLIAHTLPTAIVQTQRGVSSLVLTLIAVYPQTVPDSAFAVPELELQPELIAYPQRAVMQICK